MESLQLSKVLKRELKGVNVNRYAASLKISSSLLRHWHRGSRIPSGKDLGIVLKLSDFLGLSLEQLLFDRCSRLDNSTTFSKYGRAFRIRIEEVSLDNSGSSCEKDRPKSSKQKRSK